MIELCDVKLGRPAHVCGVQVMTWRKAQNQGLSMHLPSPSAQFIVVKTLAGDVPPGFLPMGSVTSINATNAEEMAEASAAPAGDFGGQLSSFADKLVGSQSRLVEAVASLTSQVASLEKEVDTIRARGRGRPPKAKPAPKAEAAEDPAA